MTKPTLTNEQVAAFLRNHDDFFVQRSDLLELLRLPDPTGASASLLERQAQVLRDRNNELRSRLSNLLDIARENDRLFEKTRKLVLRLVEAPHLSALLTALITGLELEFTPDCTTLLLYDDVDIPVTLNSSTRHLVANQLHEALQVMLSSNRAICGVLRPTELQQLFPNQHEGIRSAAMVPLFRQRQLGLLAIGSRDVNHFKSSLDTLFITHIGDVMSRLLERFLPPLPAQKQRAQ